jgi:hypothetical protein
MLPAAWGEYAKRGIFMRNKIAAVLVSAAMLTALTGCQKEIAVEELPILNYTAPEQ